MKKECNSQKGITLIELMVSVVVAAIVLFAVFFLWNYIDLHIVKSEHLTKLENETNRIGTQISQHIKKSPQIIDWNANRVEMIDFRGTDTLIYLFNDGQLLMNGTPITILLPDAKVKSFELKNLNENISETAKSLLLDLNLTIENRTGDSCSVHYTIQLPQTTNNTGSEDSWGF